jgi:hypothetical protein
MHAKPRLHFTHEQALQKGARWEAEVGAAEPQVAHLHNDGRGGLAEVSAPVQGDTIVTRNAEARATAALGIAAATKAIGHCDTQISVGGACSAVALYMSKGGERVSSARKEGHRL